MLHPWTMADFNSKYLHSKEVISKVECRSLYLAVVSSALPRKQSRRQWPSVAWASQRVWSRSQCLPITSQTICIYLLVWCIKKKQKKHTWDKRSNALGLDVGKSNISPSAISTVPVSDGRLIFYTTTSVSTVFFSSKLPLPNPLYVSFLTKHTDKGREHVPRVSVPYGRGKPPAMWIE